MRPGAAPGFVADLLVLGPNLELRQVFRNGQLLD